MIQLTQGNAIAEDLTAPKNFHATLADIEFMIRSLVSFRRWIRLESGFLVFIKGRWTIVNQHKS